MKEKVIKVYNVLDNEVLPEITVTDLPSDGDPIELDDDMYYVCERAYDNKEDPRIGVIPLIIRNPASVSNIEQYVKCLSMAHRKVMFKNKHGISSLEASEEMIIS